MFNPEEHMMDLKGRKYLQVMWRLVWFRADKPHWCIDTNLEQLTEDHAVFSAKIYDEGGVLKSAAYGSESVRDFRDFIEKAETKAVGRALAMLGYGTQFAPELDEGERIVDSPVQMKPAQKQQTMILCANCNGQIKPAKKKDGTILPAAEIAAMSEREYGKPLCVKCQLDILETKRQMEGKA